MSIWTFTTIISSQMEEISAGRPGGTDSPDAYLQGEVEHLHQELRALQDRNYQLVQDNIKLTRHLRQEHHPQQTATEEHAARTRRREVHAQKTRSRWGSWNAKPKGSTQLTRDIEAMLGQCWADVVDGGPALTQHWFNVSCLMGISAYFTSDTAFWLCWAVSRGCIVHHVPLTKLGLLNQVKRQYRLILIK